MKINLQGYRKGFELDVQETSLIMHVRAVVRYYLGVRCNIALVYQGRYLRDGPDLHDYGIQDGSTLLVELRYLNS